MTDTIFALASGQGRAGVAVIRVSGPRAGAALRALTDRPLPAPRRAVRRRFVDSAGGPLDDGLALWFPAPESFTGEDVAELQGHGGRAVVAGLLAALGAVPGCRPAEAGEFTRRAFLAGRMDLTAVEGLADLIAAETEAQRRQALRQMDGGLAALYDGWRDRLVRAAAHLEATIDFAEEDIPDALDRTIAPAVAALAAEIEGHLADDRRGERLRDGLAIAIVGAPNAGKSSLLNRVARREAAIVSTTAGTTRDVIEVALDLGGYPVTLADTAGLRAAVDTIEAEGVRRARARAAAADVKLAVFDGAHWPAIDPETAALIDDDTVVILNKRDACAAPEPHVIAGRPALAVSALTGDGMAALLDRLEALAEQRMAVGAAPALTQARHRAALQDCRAALARAAGAPLPDLMAEDLRLAARALGRITGRVEVDDLLDVIFRDFCIGK